MFGVQSVCKLEHCAAIHQDYFKVKVIPALPKIQLVSSLPKSADFLSFGEEFNIVTSGTAVLYTGQVYVYVYIITPHLYSSTLALIFKSLT